jgi:transcription-repair coupling factor (superfamily II helicase)
VPRETATWSDFDFDEPPEENEPEAIPRAPAYIPLDYIRDAKPRIEFYRKLAQATDKPSVQRVAVEMRDRFGPLPRAVDTLLQVTELKLLAAEKGISSIETRGNKLMLTQRGDLVMVEGKFPRLTKRDAAGRVKEIRKLLLGLS